MADRYRSRDGVQETRQFIDDANTPAQQGRSGGNLERKVGTRDLLKRAAYDLMHDASARASWHTAKPGGRRCGQEPRTPLTSAPTYR